MVSEGGDPMDGDQDRVLWQARPTARAVVGDLLVALSSFSAVVVLFVVVKRADPWIVWPGIAVLVLSVAAKLVAVVRGRVVITRDGIEVRRILTRRYRWSSLRSITIEDDGRIEITPQGWVRKLPIPRDEVPDAFAVINSWRSAAQAGT